MTEQAMKVVAYFSYKGGQGRSLTLANHASCLYRLGYNVVVLDLDFAAPGVAAKFDISVFEDERLAKSGGALDYLLESIAKGEPLESIEPHILTIASRDLESGQKAMLRIVPSGFPGSDEKYWTPLSSPSFLGLFDHGGDHQRKGAFLVGLQEAIGRLDPPPHYLLIDARAGITTLGSMALISLPQVVFCFFGKDPENLDGSRLMLRAFSRLAQTRASLGLPSKSVRVLPVLSRVPISIQDRAETHRAELSASLGETYAKEMLLIQSDPYLERKPCLRIPPEGNVVKTGEMGPPLIRDYLVLLAAGFPETIRKKHAGQSDLDCLGEALGISFGVPAEEEEAFKRVFLYLEEYGEMVNPEDHARNVAFKVETFCAMLDDIHASLVHHAGLAGLPKQISLDRARAAFYETGRVCGLRFGSSLVADVWKGGMAVSAAERLHKWCKFDSSVGFGRMTARDLHEQQGRLASGAINILRNFLAVGKSGYDLCSLMSGYIAGVLSMLLDEEVKVTHEAADCMRAGKDHCSFRFKLVSKKD